MARYAEGTQVPADRSRAEIERLLQRFGASRFAYGWMDGSAAISFQYNSKLIRLVLPLPQADDDAIVRTARGRVRTSSSIEEAMRGEERRRWRSLCLCVKAKLEAVESGIATFEQEWLAHVVLPDGKTVGDTLIPQIDDAASTGRMPMLQLGMGSR